MNRQFLEDHLIDFEVIAALGIGALLRYGFGTSWVVTVLCVVIPLVILLVAHIMMAFRR